MLETTNCRSPHGERGLKSVQLPAIRFVEESLSSRRAWIEIPEDLFEALMEAWGGARRGGGEIKRGGE